MENPKEEYKKKKSDLVGKKQMQDFPGVPSEEKKNPADEISKKTVQKLSKEADDGKMDNTEKAQD